jgi:HupE / UreJ protein
MKRSLAPGVCMGRCIQKPGRSPKLRDCGACSPAEVGSVHTILRTRARCLPWAPREASVAAGRYGSRPSSWKHTVGFVLQTVAALLAMLLVPRFAFAHRGSDAYLQVALNRQRVQIVVELSVRDLDSVFAFAPAQETMVRWQDIDTQRSQLIEYVRAGVQVSGCVLEPNLADEDANSGRPQTQPYPVERSDGISLQFDIRFTCSENQSESHKLHYALIFERNAEHRALVTVRAGGEISNAGPGVNLGEQISVLDRKTRELELVPEAPLSAWATLRSMLRDGFLHILNGPDHLAFLLVLLLPSVLLARRFSQRTEPQTSLRAVLVDVAKVVTAFTVAHSFTLSASALDLVVLPSQLVETTIALSVMLAAINNVSQKVAMHRWPIAFILGLIHGFGIAGTLDDASLRGSNKALALLGFNVGVELGQLACVAVLVPLLFALRKHRLYQPVVVVLGSLLIFVVATVWALERATNTVVFR